MGDCPSVRESGLADRGSARRTSRQGALVLLLGGVLLALVVPMLLVYRDSMRRYTLYGLYANALNQYHETHGVCPRDRETLERSFVPRNRQAEVLPPPAPYEPPIFRSAAGLPAGSYLVVIEPEPVGLFSWTRVLIYARPDGAVRETHSTWVWEVAERISEDDARRGRAGGG